MENTGLHRVLEERALVYVKRLALYPANAQERYNRHDI